MKVLFNGKVFTSIDELMNLILSKSIGNVVNAPGTNAKDPADKELENGSNANTAELNTNPMIDTNPLKHEVEKADQPLLSVDNSELTKNASSNVESDDNSEKHPEL